MMRPVADAQSVSMPWNTSTNIVLTGSDVEESPLTFEIVDNPAHGSLSGSDANRQYTPTADTQGQIALPSRPKMEPHSAPATVSINVTAYTISGNAGVAVQPSATPMARPRPSQRMAPACTASRFLLTGLARSRLPRPAIPSRLPA